MQRFYGFILFFLLASCSGRKPYTPGTAEDRNNVFIKEAAGVIQTGDIVFRCGKDMTSYRIRALSEKDQTYSHAGIAVVTPEGVMVYHITSPDVDESPADTVLRLEPLERFARSENNLEFGFGRFNLNKQQVENITDYLRVLHKARVSFDYRFDLNTADKVYCSEMIDRVLRVATNDTIGLQRKYLTDPKLIQKVSAYLSRDEKTVQSAIYIPIDNIYLDPHFSMIAQYKFEK